MRTSSTTSTIAATEFYIRVNDTGRNFRLVTAPVAAPGRANWRELVAHRDAVMLQGVLRVQGPPGDGRARERAAADRHSAFADGATHRVAFPEAVYSVFPANNPEFDTTLLRYSYQSFVTPASVYDYDMAGRTATLLKRQEVLGGYDSERYTSERVYATASDGTKVPVSIVYRKDTKRDGTAPLYLGGYGSYGISQNVGFSSNRVSLLDRGVVMAYAHVRGGGDLGKPWHDAGRMLNKKNTFTDFIAAAEHLLANGYGAKDRFVIEGGSAGGLLMGAVANMRPDLFKAVVLQVPFVDVINTMLDESLPLTVAEFEEWGNPKKKDEYDYMKTYSPYDNITARAYPAMLVKTSLNDSQVGFHEPAKYVARMRATRTDTEPAGLQDQHGRGTRRRLWPLRSPARGRVRLRVHAVADGSGGTVRPVRPLGQVYSRQCLRDLAPRAVCPPPAWCQVARFVTRVDLTPTSHMARLNPTQLPGAGRSESIGYQAPARP